MSGVKKPPAVITVKRHRELLKEEYERGKRDAMKEMAEEATKKENDEVYDEKS